MTYTPLDPSDAIVLFADLQAGIIERAATNDLASLRRTVAALAKLAQLFEIPAIVTTAPGVARIMPEIAAALGELPQHPRTTTDAFTHAPTREAIVGTGRTTLLIAAEAADHRRQQYSKAKTCGERPGLADLTRPLGLLAEPALRGDRGCAEGRNDSSRAVDAKWRHQDRQVDSRCPVFR
jgi:hypothetical protein